MVFFFFVFFRYFFYNTHGFPVIPGVFSGFLRNPQLLGKDFVAHIHFAFSIKKPVEINLNEIPRSAWHIFIKKNILNIRCQKKKIFYFPFRKTHPSHALLSFFVSDYKALSLNFVYLDTHVSSTLSVGPLLCFAILTSHTPGFSVFSL